MPTDPTLIVMAKAPLLGQVKTRLAATMGPTAALAVYEQLLALTASVAKQWSGSVVVHVSGDIDSLPAWPFAGFPTLPQSGITLGDRMAHAFNHHLGRGPVMMIGTDCPEISPSALAEVTELLKTNPVAVGPAADGGYWGVAIRDPAAVPVVCAATLPWSKPELLDATQAACNQAGLTLGIGTKLADCDTENEYRHAVLTGFLN